MVVVKNYIPEKGDLVYLNLNPTKGREQKGFRPALVISSRRYNSKSELCLIMPITTKIKGYPFECVLPNNSEIKGIILADQIRLVSFTDRKVKFIEKVNIDFVDDVINLFVTIIK